MSEISILNSDPEVVKKFKGHKKAITSLAFHPNTTQLISSSRDNSLMLWNISSKTARCYNFSGHDDIVTSVDFSGNGDVFASASYDQNVRLWVPTIKGGSKSFRAHTAAVRTVVFSPDSTKLITGSNDKSIKTWDTDRQKFITSYTGHNNWVNSVNYNNDGKIIASCSDDCTLRIWDSDNGRIIHSFPTTKAAGNHLSFHPNGVSVAVAMSSGSVRVYDIRSLKLQQHYILHDNTKYVTWHPYANYMLTCGKDGMMRIVDAMEGRPLYTLKSDKESVECAAFSKDGKYFACGGEDKLVEVWKTNFISLKDSASTSTSQETI